jgi:hypothetical protein
VIRVEALIENLGTIHDRLIQCLHPKETGSAGYREHRPFPLIIVDGQPAVDLNRKTPAVEYDPASVDRRAAGIYHGALNRNQLGIALESTEEDTEPLAFWCGVVVEDGHSFDPLWKGRNAGVDCRSETQPSVMALHLKGPGPQRCVRITRKHDDQHVGCRVERGHRFEAAVEVGRTEGRNHQSSSHWDEYSHRTGSRVKSQE